MTRYSAYPEPAGVLDAAFGPLVGLCKGCGRTVREKQGTMANTNGTDWGWWHDYDGRRCWRDALKKLEAQ